ncbi:MAG: hypothetical protein ACO35E_02740 [Ilumatobacteraceae bacterium]
MNADPRQAQRRRLGLAVAVTVVAIPALWPLGDDRPDDISTVVAGAEVALSADGQPTPSPSDGTDDSVVDDPLGIPSPAHLERRVTVAPVIGGTIAIPAASDGLAGSAAFDYDIEANDLCHARGAPLGLFVTVVNLENNRSTTCIAVLEALPGYVEVVLHPDRFAAIGDPTDAPVPVEYRW